MTKEELEKATGQELIEQRDYCGVDGYYGDYLDNVNAEMLKRFNRLAELEEQIEKMKCCGNCIHCYEGAYHNGYRCKDHARESVCDNWEIMTDEIRKEMLEDDL